MKELIEKYKAWKLQHQDRNYQYDEIFDFVNSEVSRGDMLAIMESIEYRHDVLQPTPCKHKDDCDDWDNCFDDNTDCWEGK